MNLAEQLYPFQQNKKRKKWDEMGAFWDFGNCKNKETHAGSGFHVTALGLIFIS